MRRHRSAVGVSQRDLVLPRAVQLRQHVFAARASLADRRDLLSQILDPRTTCLAFRGVALVEPLQIVAKLGVGQLDEILQGGAGEVAGC